MADCWATCLADTSAEPEFKDDDPYFSNQGEAGTCVRHALAKALNYKFKEFVSKKAYKEDGSLLKARCVDPEDSFKTEATVNVLVNGLSKSGAKGCWPEDYDEHGFKLVGRRGKVYELKVSVQKRSGPCQAGDVVVVKMAELNKRYASGHSLHAVFCQVAEPNRLKLRNSWGSHMEWIPVERGHKAIECFYDVQITDLVQQKMKGRDEQFLTAAHWKASAEDVKPGLNIGGKCAGHACSESGKMVWCSLGNNPEGEDLMMMPARCPKCGQGLEDGGDVLGFYQCSWDISGCCDEGDGSVRSLRGDQMKGTASDDTKMWPLKASGLNFRKLSVKTW